MKNKIIILSLTILLFTIIGCKKTVVDINADRLIAWNKEDEIIFERKGNIKKYDSSKQEIFFIYKDFFPKVSPDGEKLLISESNKKLTIFFIKTKEKKMIKNNGFIRWKDNDSIYYDMLDKDNLAIFSQNINTNKSSFISKIPLKSNHSGVENISSKYLFFAGKEGERKLTYASLKKGKVLPKEFENIVPMQAEGDWVGDNEYIFSGIYYDEGAQYGPSTLWLLNLDTNKATELTQKISKTWQRYPVVSANEKLVAFLYDQAPNTKILKVLNLKSKKTTQIDSGNLNTSFVWSLDSKSIAYIKNSKLKIKEID